MVILLQRTDRDVNALIYIKRSRCKWWVGLPSCTYRADSKHWITEQVDKNYSETYFVFNCVGSDGWGLISKYLTYKWPVLLVYLTKRSFNNLMAVVKLETRTAGGRILIWSGFKNVYDPGGSLIFDTGRKNVGYACSLCIYTRYTTALYPKSLISGHPSLS